MLNFLVVDFPTSMPNRSHILLANVGFEQPANTLMFGILLFKSKNRKNICEIYSKFNKCFILKLEEEETHVFLFQNSSD